MKKVLTTSLEDYLEVIYIINQRGQDAGITNIAKFLSFSKASVNRAINILKSENLVMQEKYGKIILTEKGKAEAKKVYKKHKILAEFFIKVLKVSPQIAEIDACRAEHVLSFETLRCIEKYLNFLEEI